MVLIAMQPPAVSVQEHVFKLLLLLPLMCATARFAQSLFPCQPVIVQHSSMRTSLWIRGMLNQLADVEVVAETPW